MTASDGPYLFDVGVVALAHAQTPVSDEPLRYVRQAVEGEIDGVVPYPVLFGARAALSNYYGTSDAEASRLMSNLAGANRIYWYERMTTPTVRSALHRSTELGIEGWDGYYAEVALREGVGTVLTLDTDFERIDGVRTTVLLTPAEHERLAEHIETGQ